MASQLAGHLLVDGLLAQGVTHAFGVPGESYLAVLDGLHARRHQIRFITCRQEGGAAFMAKAHGKLTGRSGVCMVMRGPGATNASSGVRITRTDEFEVELPAALARPEGTVIEVTLDPEVITTRATLSSITQGALNKSL